MQSMTQIMSSPSVVFNLLQCFWSTEEQRIVKTSRRIKIGRCFKPRKCLHSAKRCQDLLSLQVLSPVLCYLWAPIDLSALFVRRMNVMLTRAKRALILIGHRDALYTCALWKQWVQHVKSEGLVVEPVARQPGGACAEAVYRGTRAGRNRRGAAGRGARYRDSEDRPETGSDKFQGGTSTSGSRRNTSGGRKPRGSRGGWGVGRGQTGGADREVIYSRHSQ